MVVDVILRSLIIGMVVATRTFDIMFPAGLKSLWINNLERKQDYLTINRSLLLCVNSFIRIVKFKDKMFNFLYPCYKNQIDIA